MTHLFCRFWLWCSSGSFWTSASPRESWAGWTTWYQRARRRRKMTRRRRRRWNAQLFTHKQRHSSSVSDIAVCFVVVQDAQRMLEDEDDPPYDGGNVLKFPVKNLKVRWVDKTTPLIVWSRWVTAADSNMCACVVVCAAGTRRRWTSQMKWPKVAFGSRCRWPLTAAKLWNAA